MCKKKMATCAQSLTRYTPQAFQRFAEAVVNLKFDEEPKYYYYRSLFEPHTGPAVGRPIVLEELPKAGQKRAREENEQYEEEDEVYSSVCLFTDPATSMQQQHNVGCMTRMQCAM